MKTIDKKRWLEICEQVFAEVDPAKFRASCAEVERFLREKKQRLSFHPACRLCGRQVDLLESRTDAEGRAVHEECQAKQLRCER